MGSSRFPGKPMKDILGMPMIGHVYKRVKMNKTLSEVYVATCDKEIFDCLGEHDALPPDFDHSINEITLRNIDYEDGAIFELLTSPVEDNILFEVV